MALSQNGKTYGSEHGSTDRTTNSAPSTSDDNSKSSSVSDGENKSSSAEKRKARSEEDQRLLDGRRRRLAFVVEMVLVFAVYLPFALLAPFFTTRAEQMGLSPLQVGILLGVFAGISSLFSIFIGQFLHQIGPKFAFVAGGFVVAGCSILMAPQKDLTSDVQFFWFSFATFLVWSVGHAATNTSCTAMISHNFPGNEPVLFGVMESFIGLAFLFGGPVGSILYKIGDYDTPFYVFGSFLLIIVVFNFFIISSYDTRSHEQTSLFQLLYIPSVWTTCLALTFTFGFFGIITIGLAVHLTDHFEVKDAYAGFFWVLSGAFKTISSTLIGSLTNKLIERHSAAARIILICGQILGCMTLLLIGPTTKLPDKLAFVCIGLALEGIVKSCVIVPALVDITVTARWSGLPDNFATQSVIAGLFWGAFSFGTFLGPILGGSLINAYGFEGACNFSAIAFLIIGAILSIYLSWEYRCGKGRREPFRLFTISGSNAHGDDIPLVER